MIPPHDLEAERDLLGDLMRYADDRIERAGMLVEPGDFYSPAHAAVFAAMRRLRHHGHQVTVEAMRDELRDAGEAKLVPFEALRDLMFAGSGSWERHADRVAKLATCRQYLAIARDVQAAASAGDPDTAYTAAKGIERPLNGALHPDIHNLGALSEESQPATPWIIPGLIRADWRLMIVAAEGAGKSELERQIACASSQGIHPLTNEAITPIRTAIVDFENARRDTVHSSLALTRKAAALSADPDLTRVSVWTHPRGMSMRSRNGRAHLDRLLSRHRPDLVVLGPVYKAGARPSPRETTEQAVAEFMDVIDDLKDRHGCAFLLEHHAPFGFKGSREMRPSDTSLWLRWPEVGLGLNHIDRGGKIVQVRTNWLSVTQWRGPRSAHNWPEQIHRGGPSDVWPWHGFNHDGLYGKVDNAEEPF